MTSVKRKLLFVDDDKHVLDAFRRLFGTMRDNWDMEFVTSGEDALQRLDDQPFDVLITDMRMPGIDGAQLLKETKRRYPHLIRLVLSGHADQEQALRCIGVTHQFLDKPCDAGLLRSRVNGALALRDLLRDEALQRLLSEVESVPSLPEAYQEIMEELQSDEPSINQVGKIIAKDVGMTAKVLQLVNSAFFGLRGRVSNPEQAVKLVGLNTITSLVLMINVFSQVTREKLGGFDLAKLWQHSLATGLLSKEIARRECQDRVTVDDAYTAGLLHAIGMLILAELRKDYSSIIRSAETQRVALWEVEKSVIGATSSQVGAYLMALWGLPHAVVEAVAWHKHPSSCPNPEFCPLTTVHVANALLDDTAPELPLDRVYLEQLWPENELVTRLEQWKRLTEEIRGRA
jgi:HD-like signal output (HDOD) protein/ActR/RegA family two-component response regulator